jgi:hypothetical protein
MKTVAFKTRKPADADEWVHTVPESARPAEPMKRFTIDVPAALHRRIKLECASQGTLMADVIRNLLERTFPKS